MKTQIRLQFCILMFLPVPFISADTFVPGDADQDHDVDALDLVKVSQAGKYGTGQPATFGEGDFNGDGVYNSGDLVEMFTEGAFETGPYDTPLPGVGPVIPMPVSPIGAFGDISFSYSLSTGLLTMSNPLGVLFDTLYFSSSVGLFVGPRPPELVGLFDLFASGTYFKFDPAGFSSISSIDLGTGLNEAEVLGGLRVAGSLKGGGALTGGRENVPEGGVPMVFFVSVWTVILLIGGRSRMGKMT